MYKYIKFDAFLKLATDNNAVIATGHYAKINYEESVIEVPEDRNKDQTYFLYQIKKENLEIQGQQRVSGRQQEQVVPQAEIIEPIRLSKKRKIDEEDERSASGGWKIEYDDK